MKILLEGHRLARATNYGGIDSYWHNLVPELLKLHSADANFSLFTAFLNPKHLKSLRPYIESKTKIKHWWASPDFLARFNKLELFAGSHDLVHIPEPIFKFKTSAKLVVTAHDLMYLHHPQYLNSEWVQNLMVGTERLASQAEYWICNSEHTRNDLIKHYNIPRGRTQVVHMGVSEDFRLAYQNLSEIDRVRQKLECAQSPYFLFVGSVEPKKNIENLLRGFGMALKRGLQSNLLIGGRAGWKSELVKKVAAEMPQLKGRVHFLGFVDQTDLPALVAGARSLVLPSRYEGFGMPVAEAMCAGTPVLCSDRGSLPEVAGGAAKLFDPDDVELIANLIEQLDSDQHLFDKMRAAGLERSKAFSWQKCANETFSSYRKAIALTK